MKLSRIALFGAAVMTLAACSNEEPMVENAQNTTEAYTTLNISLPTSTGTRALEGTDAGTENEWAVVNGKILVFQNGTNEANATLVCVSELSGMSWSEGKGGDITTSSKAIAHLQNINLTDDGVQYSAVVVLNYNENFVFPSEGTTYGAWSETAQTNSMTLVKDGTTYLTMSQAPRFNTDNSDPLTLVSLDKKAIAPTENALTRSSATFHVERGVAKVTVTAGTHNVTGSNYTGDKVDITAWALDVTNRSTFPVQVTTGLMSDFSDIWKTGRFLGDSESSFRRIFWAKDPNYSTDITSKSAVTDNFNLIGNADLKSNPACAYCLENTFDIKHQLQGQTTRVVLKGLYKPAGIAEGETFFKLGSNSRLWTADALAAEIKTRTQTAANNSNVTVDLGDLKTKAGMYALSAVTIKVGDANADAAVVDAVAKALGLGSASTESIGAYLNGECYYVARIKHFGNEQTKWEIGNPTYDNDNAKWLGRYGVVRNTAYEVKVNSISNPGVPSVPEIDPTVPDDVNDYYIDVQVNILSWSKRVNSEDL